MARPIIGGRRSAIEILFEMLSVCKEGGANKTAIMYLSNLSYDQLLRYLDFLNAHNLVLRDDRSGHFHITDRGQDTLNQVQGVIDLLRELQEEEATPKPARVKVG